MSLLTIIQDASRHCALDMPQVAFGSTDRAVSNLVEFATETAKECARRADWRVLTKAAAVSLSGASVSLPADCDRLAQGASVVLADGTPLRGGLSRSEWATLTTQTGTPRYFMKDGGSLYIWPVPAAPVTATIRYISTEWARSNATPAVPSSDWMADTDASVFPDELLTMGVVWRQNRHVGKDYSDYMAQFEAMLADHVRIDGGMRTP